MADLSESDIDDLIAPKIYTQDYSKKITIEGVQIIPVKNFVGEDGDFTEIIRLKNDSSIEGLPNFKVEQISRTKLFPGAIKGWHLHLKQDDLWYVSPSYHLLVGLWDVRKNSSTKGATQRIVLGGGKSELLFIPKGVAHGASNVTKQAVEVIYFVNKKFDIDNPDEKRLKWDLLGREFWLPLKD